MKEKTISYSRVLEILSDAQLKNVLGGSGSGGSGSGGNGSGGDGSGTVCTDGSNLACWDITCDNGDTYVTACSSGIALCEDGGCATRCVS